MKKKKQVVMLVHILFVFGSLLLATQKICKRPTLHQASPFKQIYDPNQGDPCLARAGPISMSMLEIFPELLYLQ